MELKNQMFDLQKLNHDNQLLQQENGSLKESVWKRQKEASEAADRIYELEKSLRESEMRQKQASEKEEKELL